MNRSDAEAAEKNFLKENLHGYLHEPLIIPGRRDTAESFQIREIELAGIAERHRVGEVEGLRPKLQFVLFGNGESLEE